VRSGNRPGGGSAGSNDDGRLAGDSSCGEVADGVRNVFEAAVRSMTGTTAPLARRSVRRSRIAWCSLLIEADVVQQAGRHVGVVAEAGSGTIGGNVRRYRSTE
jgi:hypothetical protein